MSTAILVLVITFLALFPYFMARDDNDDWVSDQRRKHSRLVVEIELLALSLLPELAIVAFGYGLYILLAH